MTLRRAPATPAAEITSASAGGRAPDQGLGAAVGCLATGAQSMLARAIEQANARAERLIRNSQRIASAPPGDWIGVGLAIALDEMQAAGRDLRELTDLSLACLFDAGRQCKSYEAGRGGPTHSSS